jgi:antitoxin component HigA of HigAB toxin-antitoxin module
MNILTEQLENQLDNPLDKIKKCVEERGLKRTVLAKQIGVSQQYISCILLKQRPLTDKMRKKFAKVLEIDLRPV